MLQLKSFAIDGFLGTKNLHIDFAANERGQVVKILVGENGSGKTQLLNIVYYALSGNLFRLAEFAFEKITIVWETEEGQKEQEIKKEDVTSVVKIFYYREPIVQTYIENLGLAPFIHLRNKILNFDFNFNPDEAWQDIEHNLTSDMEYSFKKLLSEIHHKHYHNANYTSKLEKQEQEDKTNIINSNPLYSSFERFFFPSNRIVEKNMPLTGYRKVPIKGFEDKNAEYFSNLENAKFSLNDSITKMVQVFTEKKEKYTKQRPYDDAIESFCEACNSYLLRKKFVYDKHKIYITLVDENGAEMVYSALSSGERQIIHIFTKLYLQPEEKPLMLIIDEPELSMSVRWQRRILPDILASGKCVFLLAATHSPYIFDNELDLVAVSDIHKFFKPLQKKEPQTNGNA